MRPRPISWGGRWPNRLTGGASWPRAASTVTNCLIRRQKHLCRGKTRLGRWMARSRWACRACNCLSRGNNPLSAYFLPGSSKKRAERGRGAPKGTGRPRWRRRTERDGRAENGGDLRPAKALTVRRRGGGAGVGLRRRQLPGGVDQRHMGESLRKIADQALALGVVLFR